MEGFIDSRDCTFDAGLAYLEDMHPDSNFTFSCSSKTNNLCIKIDGSLAMKQEKMTQNGYKLCNEFSTIWEENNKKKTCNI